MLPSRMFFDDMLSDLTVENKMKCDIYEKDGIKAISKGDLLTITQNGQIFELSRKK